MIKNSADQIAASMDAMLKDKNFTDMFSSAAIIEKLAFKRNAEESALPTEMEQEVSDTIAEETALESTAGNDHDTCVNCFKKRADWTEADGLCNCKSKGCNPIEGCKAGCDCGCSSAPKHSEVQMSDSLVKSAFNSLLQASSDLEEAGFEALATDTLILLDSLISEAKKGDPKKAKEKEKAAAEKLKAAKEKEKARAEKDKQAARDKAAKEKARAEKDKNDAKDKASKEKERAKAKSDADKLKADKAKSAKK